ncbi:MAG TPA: cytochrome P450, partial [Actinopolymorphaceae bacterium]|nr:cytochrome P450 [Actinopolymorphaceae bacterium]
MAHASIFEQILDDANRADPYRLYAARREEPVRREADGTYVVSTYDAIVALLHDPRISSEERDGPGGRPAGDEADELPPSFILRDPPEHDRVRRLLMRHFGPPHTPGRVDGMRTDIHAIVTRLIDGFASRDRIDLVDDFSYPFPVTVICQLLGVPREDEATFRAWNEAILEGIGPTGTELSGTADKRRQAFTALGNYLGEL